MRSCVLAGLADWHGHTVCSPLRERSVKIFERHDVIAVFEARPTHSQSGAFLPSAAAAHGFGSRSFFELVKFVHTCSFVSDNPTGASSLGGSPVGMRFISMCCALPRAALGAILSLILCELTARAVRVFVYPAFTRLTARRREQLIVRELDGLKRRVVARPCIYPLPCARCDSHGSFYAASVHLRSLSHKLESLQASYPHMSVRR